MEIQNFTNDIWNNCTSVIVDKMISVQDKIKMRERINKLTSNEMLYIFQIVLSSNEYFSENSNGIFIDLNNFKYDTLCEINKYLDKVYKIKESESVQIVFK